MSVRRIVACSAGLAGLVLTACASDLPDVGAVLPGPDVPQDSAASTDILPMPPRTPKGKMEILGNFAGRFVTITANGDEVFAGQHPAIPPGATWWLDLHTDSYPVTITVTFEDCGGETFTGSFPEADEGPSLIVRDCEFELLTL